MAITIKFNNACSTNVALEIFKRYKEAFGNVVSAEMKNDKLTLRNDKGEKMIFAGELTTGYIGEGPNGTYRILKMVGFNIDEEYVQTSSSFLLKK